MCTAQGKPGRVGDSWASRPDLVTRLHRSCASRRVCNAATGRICVRLALTRFQARDVSLALARCVEGIAHVVALLAAGSLPARAGRVAPGFSRERCWFGFGDHRGNQPVATRTEPEPGSEAYHEGGETLCEAGHESGTVFPASAWVQSLRNSICPSRMKMWQRRAERALPSSSVSASRQHR